MKNCELGEFYKKKFKLAHCGQINDDDDDDDDDDETPGAPWYLCWPGDFEVCVYFVTDVLLLSLGKLMLWRENIFVTVAIV